MPTEGILIYFLFSISRKKINLCENDFTEKKNYFLIAGKMITDIQRAWNGLLGAEKGFEEWLLAELMRLGKNHLYYAFKK